MLLDSMRGGLKTFTVLAVVFVAAILYGELTGGAFRTDSSGVLLGQRLNNHKEREFTSVEILGERVNDEGLPIVEKGHSFRFIIKPGVNGVHTGYQVENAISGLRFEGGHCHPGTTGSFCSDSYQCVDEDPKRCSITGPKCYGDKIIEVRIPESQKAGNYFVSVCDAIDECCAFEVRGEFVVE